MTVDLLVNSVAGSRLWVAAGWTMIHFLWVGLAIALLAHVVRRALDRAPAEIRHAAVLICFAALVAAPIPIYRWSLDRVPAPLDPRRLDHPAPAGQPTPWLTMQAGAYETAPAAAPAPEVNPTSWPTLLATTLDGAARWMPLVWAAGVPVTLAFLLAGVVGVQRLRGQCHVLRGAELNRRLERLGRELGVGRTVTVALFDGVCSPVLVGILKPLILLPASVLTDLSAHQLELVLLHELAHVRRWDNLVNLFQRVAEGVLFFHPAVWLVSHWLRLEREHCCDAIVLRHSDRPRMYVETLASLAAPPGLAPRYATAAMANHQLLSRVRRILKLEDSAMRRSPSRLGLSLGSGLAAVLLLLAGFGAVLAADGKDKDIPPTTPPLAEKTQADPKPQFVGGEDLPPPPLTPAPKPIRATTAAPPAPAYKRSVSVQAAPVAHSYHPAKPVPANAAWRNGFQVLAAGPDNAPQEANRSWGPEQATGEPNVPQAADDGRAWASLSPDAQDEWLELRYNTPVEASKVLIYESYNPGAVSEVTVTDDKGNRYRAFKGPDPCAGSDMAVLIVNLAKPVTIATVRIEIASTKVPGWNEIDAVGLVDAKTNNVSWADAARASSTYAEQTPIPHARTAPGAPANEAELNRLRQEIEQLRRLIDAQKAAQRQATVPPI